MLLRSSFDNLERSKAGMQAASTLSVMTRLALFTLVLATVVAPAATSGTTIPACRGGSLRGAFTVVPGSAGAGNIVYRLTLRNASARTCFVTGIPRLQLLTRAGERVPTHARAADPGALSAVQVTLRPGRSAATTARFSPDVPGPGEQTPGRCEPIAYKLRVTPTGGGSAVVPVRPPTPVCEHGTLTLPALSKG